MMAVYCILLSIKRNQTKGKEREGKQGTGVK
jgi:hypothetical protein